MTNLSGANLNNGTAVGPQGEGKESPSTFPKYPAYKDSGVEWLNQVPDHWCSVPIKYMALERNSLFLDGDWIESKDISSDGIRYITTGNVGEGAYKEQGAGFISEETFHALGCTEVYEGDILVSRLNNPIGRACVVPDLGGRVVTSVDNVIFRPDSKFDKKFIVYLFSSEEYFKHTSNLARGATMQRISRGLLGNIRVVAPLFEEQTQIARFLDHETARIDALIEEQQHLIELLKEKRQAVISHAVTKGLDLTVPMKDSGVEWLGEVPAHWRAVRLRHCLVDALTYGANEPSDEANLEHPRYIRITDLNDDGTLSAETYKSLPPDKAEPYMLEQGDVLFARSGATVGKSFLYSRDYGPACYAGYLIRARVNKRALIPMYLWMCTQSRQYEQFIGESNIQATIQNVSAEKYGNMWIALPEIEEQEKILAELETQLSLFKSLVETSVGALVLLQERRSALISAAVTGKIDVRDWQPPASTQAPKSAVAEAD